MTDKPPHNDGDAFWKSVEIVLQAGLKMKQVMINKKLTSAKAKCPVCGGAETLHARLVVGRSAGRHQRSGGALRMWCDVCPEVRMME